MDTDPRDAEIQRLKTDLDRLATRLRLTEEALRFERQHNRFLFRTFVIQNRRPTVRPSRSTLARCADAVLAILAGPGRG